MNSPSAVSARPSLPLYPLAVRPGANARQRRLVDALVAVAIREAGDDHLTMSALAEGVGLSRATLYRRLDGVLEGSPGELLLEIRLTQAATLLTEDGGSIADVAYAVGFRGPSHFAACFRGRYGQTPTAFAEAATASQTRVRDGDDEEQDAGDED